MSDLLSPDKGLVIAKLNANANLNGRRPQWKTTIMEDDLNGRRPQWKTTLTEDNLNGRRFHW